MRKRGRAGERLGGEVRLELDMEEERYLHLKEEA